MFRLKQISLTQFRNYHSRRISFPGRIIGCCGPNGIGKTNLLDAIYYLSFTKSYFSRTDSSSVEKGFQGFRIEGIWENSGIDSQVVCILRENGKKELLVDQENCTRFSAHIGKFPVVIITPDDTALITEGSEERRKFLDTLIAQIDHEYLNQLIRYNKILQERNGFLKKSSENAALDQQLLEVLDAQMVPAGNYIHTVRKQFMSRFIPEVEQLYSVIAGESRELPGLQYRSPLLEDGFAELLKKNLQKDLALQRTSAGIHRDDLLFELEGQPFKQIASQGQRKSLLFSLKLAEFNILRKEKGFPPILLLDDIFEKLDEQRMDNLLHYVCNQNDGQVFLTDTHCHRISEILQKINVPFHLIELQ